MQNIKFNAENHSYIRMDGKRLQGITSLISKHLFPKKYEAVPENILKDAADRGKNIHFALQCYNDDDLILNHELIKNWIDFKNEHSIIPINSEVLVSDGENFATQIDMIGFIEGGLALFDYKTTYSIDKKYLSWQLSICDYLRKISMNDHKDIDYNLYGIHIDKEYKFTLIQVPRIPEEKIKLLFECELNGEIYSENEIAEIDTDALMLLESTYTDLKMQLDELDEKRSVLMNLVREQMIASGIKSFEVNDTKFTNVEDGVSQTFDSKKFKADHPELADMYIRESPKKGYLKITTKKIKQ